MYGRVALNFDIFLKMHNAIKFNLLVQYKKNWKRKANGRFN